MRDSHVGKPVGDISRTGAHYGPFRHPVRPGLSLAGVDLVVTRHEPVGLPVLRPIPIRTHAGANTPAEPLDAVARLIQQRRPSRSDDPVGLHITRFEAYSAFTRVPACVLTRSPKVTLSEGFDRSVTSTTAPAATDWSDQFVAWKLHPLGIGALARRTIGRAGNRAVECPIFANFGHDAGQSER